MNQTLRRDWTSEEDAALREAIVSGRPIKFIATEFKRTANAVKSRAYVLGLTIARTGHRRRSSSKWG